MDLTFQVPMQCCSLQHQIASITNHIHNWVLFLLWLHLIVSGVISPLISSSILGTYWGVPLSVSCHFAFSYCSWGSQGKNTEVVCHSLLQWTTFDVCILWNLYSLGKNTGVGCHALFQGTGIFPTQGLNLCLSHLLHWQLGFFTTSVSWEPCGRHLR